MNRRSLVQAATLRLFWGVVVSSAAAAVAACAGRPAPPTTTPAALARAPAPAETAWFAGQIAYTLPIGREVGRAGILVERRVEPVLARVTEIVTTQSRQPGAAPDRFEVWQEIAAGDRFTMREVTGAFKGEGTLSGDRWRWRAWQSTSRLPDGTRVESVDSLSADTQQLQVRKRVVGADGAVRITTVELLARVSRAVHDSLRTAWRSGTP